MNINIYAIPDVPTNVDPALREFLLQLKRAVEKLQEEAGE